MAEKIRLEIIALANNDAQNNSFVLLLKEENGNRRLPVVIGAFEAQAIAVVVEKIHPGRPLTHDLLYNILTAMNAEIKEVTITTLENGVFHALIHCAFSDGRAIEVDARTSDAVAMAVRFNCPIYVEAAILEEAGISFEDPSRPGTPAVALSGSLASYSIERLEQMLEDAIGQEAYERAVEIRDEIKKRKG
ncbi:MAG: bifunctional nuclease domain-containing protein [Saprospiraceae bacterium]